jgi:hypothetical protein
LPTAAGTPHERRTFRDRPLGKAAVVLVVLLAAFLVSRSCGSSETQISKERATEIARGVIDYEPDRVQVRYLKRGFQSQGFWAVSLSTVNAVGSYDKTTVVVVNGQNGDVVEIHRNRAP